MTTDYVFHRWVEPDETGSTVDAVSGRWWDADRAARIAVASRQRFVGGQQLDITFDYERFVGGSQIDGSVVAVRATGGRVRMLPSSLPSAGGYATNQQQAKYPELWQDLLASFPLSHGFIDSIGPEPRRLTLVNSPEFDESGMIIDYNLSQYASFTASTGKAAAKGVAISAWIMDTVGDDTNPYRGIVSESITATSVNYDRRSGFTNRFTAQIRGGFGGPSVGYATTIATGVWHHIVYSHKQGESLLWYDGQLVDTNTNTLEVTLVPSNWQIGNGWIGKLTNYNFYARALTQRDVDLLYSEPEGPRIRRQPRHSLIPTVASGSRIRVLDTPRNELSQIATNAQQAKYPSLWDGLVSAYGPFSFGTTFLDLLGAGFNGTVPNVDQWEDGVLRVNVLSGSNPDEVTFPAGIFTRLRTAGEATIAMWMKPTTVYTAGMDIFNNSRFGFSYYSGSFASYVSDQLSGSSTQAAPSNPVLGDWSLVSLRWKNLAYLDCGLNGVYASSTPTKSMGPSAATARLAYINPVIGTTAEVRYEGIYIWDRMLNDSELYTLLQDTRAVLRCKSQRHSLIPTFSPSGVRRW